MLHKEELVGLDFETSGLNPKVDKILLVSITYKDGTTIVKKPAEHTREEWIDFYNSCELIAHNAVFELGFIYHEYGILPKVFCTMLGFQILTNGKKELRKNSKGELKLLKLSASLPSVLDKLLGIKMDSTQKEHLQKSFIGMKPTDVFSKEQLDYAAADTIYMFKLREAILAKAERLELMHIIRMENTLAPIIAQMNYRGVKIDTNSWNKLITFWDKKLFETEKLMDKELVRLSRIYPTIRGGIYTRERVKVKIEQTSLFGDSKITENKNVGNINYASSDQILDLFTRLELPLPMVEERKDNKVVLKPSSGEDTLQLYLNEHPECPLKELLELLLVYREYSKLISTYGTEFLKSLDMNGFLCSRYSQCFTETGRLSSADVNLQNIPKKPEIRACFIPDNEGEVFVAADMSGAEIYL